MNPALSRPRLRAAVANASTPQVATPQFSVAAGSYSSAQTVTITDSTPGATIYYTTDGTYPLASSYQYTGPITVSSSEIVAAVATASGYTESDAASAEYFITSVPTRFIYTVAGSGTPGYSGDGHPGPQARISNSYSVVADSSGNVYFADEGNNVVRKVDGKTGIITTIAGTGEAADTGDNGPAASAALSAPAYLAIDATASNLYIAELSDWVVRDLNLTTGQITRLAGNPNGSSGTTGPATSLNLGRIVGIVYGPNGNVYIGSIKGSQNDIIQVDPSSGNASEYVNLTSVTPPPLGGIDTFTIDAQGSVYAWETGYRVVVKIDTSNNVTTVAGSSNAPFQPDLGDGGPATSAYLGYSGFLAVDLAGNLYISDSNDQAIREVNAQTGIINRISGPIGGNGFFGDDGDLATTSFLPNPQAIFVDNAGNIYLSNDSLYRVRKITAPILPPSNATAAPVFSASSGTYANTQTLTISSATPGAAIYVTFDNSARWPVFQGYHGPIQLTGTTSLQAVAIAPGYLRSSPVSESYTITASPSHVITTVAGSGTGGFSGAGGPAISANIGYAIAIAFDAAGDAYIGDATNNVVWKLAPSGILTIAAGNGTYGSTGDGGPAISAELAYPQALAVDKSGNLYMTDASGRVRVVTAATGIISTFAGGGINQSGFGDGGPATSGYLIYPNGLAFDSLGNLYVTDFAEGRVRMIDAKTRIISTVAGGGSSAAVGDGGPATAVWLDPSSPAIDNQNNLYFVDIAQSDRIRKVDTNTGIITTVAGGGIAGPDEDGLLATNMQISPVGVALDARGNIYFSDDNYRVREVDAATGIVTTVAGNTYSGYTGDGGEATMASLNNPERIAFDSQGNLYIPDFAVVRKVTFGPFAATPFPSLAPGSYTGPQTLTLTDGTPNATIYYTLDGSTPTTSSSVYSGPITIAHSTTVEAIAVAQGYSASQVLTAAYTIALIRPGITLTSSASSAFASNPVTFTATFAAANASPTGSVTFLDGSATLGSAAINNGTASYTTSSLAAGTHSITASYAGDSNFDTATTVALTETIEDFTFAQPSGGSTSATVQPGGTAAYTLAVTPPTGTTTPAAVSFSIAGLPSGATSSFSPASVPAGSRATTVTLSVSVPAQSAAVRNASKGLPLALGLLALPLLGFRKNLRGLARNLGLALLAIATMAALAGSVTGCGGSSKSSGTGGGGQQPQTYNLTVTATAGSLTHNTKLTLTVQ